MALALLLTAAAATASPQAPTIERPWRVTTGDTGCAVQRVYSESSHASFGVEAPIVASPWLLVTGPRKRLPSEHGEIRITLEPSGATYSVHYGTFVTQFDDTSLVRLFPDKQQIAEIAAASAIMVGDNQQQLAVDGLDHAIDAARDCTAKLLTSWGADPQPYLAGKLAKLGNLARWFGLGSYPSGARRNGKVIILIRFAADGKPTECRPVVSPDERLSSATCHIAMRHAVATMPLDDAGHPIASYTVTVVSWRRP
jgi:hypothetical protein